MKTTIRLHSSKASNPSDLLARFRGRIDELDAALVALLSERTSLSVAVAHLKSRTGLPLRTPAREAEVLRQAMISARQPLTPAATARIFRTILSEMRALQRSAASAPPRTRPAHRR